MPYYNDLNTPLTEAQIRDLAPSVFSVDAHESRSDRFRPIPTFEVVRALAKEGFSVVDAKQSVTRDPSRKPFTKHLLRLRRLDEADEYTRDGCVFETLLKNANDGSAAYDLLAGFYRFICGNGMICGTTIADVKVRHSGNVSQKVVDGTFEVLKSSQLLLEAPAKFGAVGLTTADQLAFAEAAHVLRFGETPDGDKPAVAATQLLTAHRPEDRGNDLWHVFNRVQENATKGGLTGRAYHEGVAAKRRTTTREVKGIDQTVGLNKGLWVLADYFAKQKAELAA